MKLKDLTKQEVSWSLYDVACSAFTMLLSSIIPPYIATIGQEVMALSAAQTTANWSFVQSGATLVVALLAPFLGVLADRQGQKMKFFKFFFLLGASLLLLMAFVDNYYLLLAVNLLICIGYAGTNIFYDAFLVDVTDDQRMDFISSFGYALGYIGSCIPFVISIYLYIAKPFGLSTVLAIKLGIAITAIWWFVFSLPLLRNVQQKYYVTGTAGGLLRNAARKVGGTLKLIVKNRTIGLFLLAYFFYIDGVDTIIKLSTSYGQAVGLQTESMIVALLVTQLVAFPAVLVFAQIAKRFSTKRVLLVCVAVYFCICIFGFFMQHAWQFWVMAITVGLVQGTIQALSRSYFGKIVPKEHNNEYFGFYNIFGKYATIVGPLLMGVFTLVTGNPRYGVLSIALLFVLGFAILWRVPEQA